MCLLIVLACLLSTVGCTYGKTSEPPRPQYEYADRLHFGVGGEASAIVRELFEMGEASFPALIEMLEDPRSSAGSCGRLSLEAVFVIVEDNWEPPMTGVTIAETAFYLLLAISLDDLYFDETCALQFAGQDQRELEGILERLRDLRNEFQQSPSERLSAEKLQSWMTTHQLEFRRDFGM